MFYVLDCHRLSITFVYVNINGKYINYEEIKLYRNNYHLRMLTIKPKNCINHIRNNNAVYNLITYRFNLRLIPQLYKNLNIIYNKFFSFILNLYSCLILKYLILKYSNKKFEI